MRRSLTVLALAILAVLGSCRDQDITSPDLTRPQFAILDAAHGEGNPDFFFLPPLVPNPVNDPEFEKDEFNPNLQPHIEVCKLGLVEGEEVCVGGKIVLTTDGDLTLPATLVPDEEHYKAEWDTGVSGLEAGKIYRVFAFVGSTELGFLDVTPRTGGMKNATTDDEFLFQDGRTLPVRFRIESGALCDPPGTKPCASSTIDLEEGGEVVLEETGDRIDIPAQDEPFVETVTVTVRLCDEDIDVDVPPFGNCLDIRSDPRLDETTTDFQGFSPRAVVSMCSLIDSGILPPDPQRRLITLHRQNDAGDIQALPHTHSFCGETEVGSLWSSGFRHLAQRGIDALRRGASWLGSPRPLHARARALRLDVGHAGESPFISKFQFALPAQMEVVQETNNQTAAGGAAVAEAPAVFVSDRDGNPVERARVHFEVVDEAGSVLPAFAVSDEEGIAQVDSWTLGQVAGIYRLRAFGFGIAGTGDDGPFAPALPTDDPEPELPPDPVPLSTGEVLFTGVVCEGEACSVGTIDLAEGGSVVLEATGDRIDIPPQGDDPIVESVTITMELCDGIDVDLPTFGNCLRITSDPELSELNEGLGEWTGLSPRAVVSMCSAFQDADLDALLDEQLDLVTLHRERDDGVVQALPHANDRCVVILGGGGSGEGAGLAQRSLDALRRGVTRLAGPRPLMAGARPVRLDVGHAGESPFISKFQLALPARFKIVAETGIYEAPAGGPIFAFSPFLCVEDRAGNPVGGARIQFEVAGGGGSVEPDSNVTDPKSNGCVPTPGWTLGEAAGVINTLRAFGKGIADPGEEPFMPALPTEDESPQEPVLVGTGEVTFTAIGLGLVSHWTADATHPDAYGDEVGPNHGVVDGSVPRVPGVIGNAFQFTGDGSVVTAPAHGWGDANRLTVALWAWMDPAGSAIQNQRFITMVPGEKVILRQDGHGDGRTLGFVMGFGDPATDHEIREILVEDVLAAGCWHHVVGTYDGETMRVYLDGALAGDLVVEEPLRDRSVSVDRMFLSSPESDEALTGLLDEVEVHNRALNPAEIEASFEAPGPDGTCALVAPTGTVQGTVTDATTEEPIANAEVHVVGTSLVASTSPQGAYQLNQVPAGSQTIRVTMIGYADQEQEVLVEGGVTTTADFALIPISTAVFGAVVRAYAGILPVYSAVTDELDWTGSTSDFDQLSQGHLDLAFGTTTTQSVEDLIAGQRLADDGVQELDALDGDPMERAGVRVWKALVYLTIADMFEDWVLEEGGMAVGPGNMLQLYQDAVVALDEAHALALAHDPGNFLTLLSKALSARAHFSQEVWGKARNPDQEPVIVQSANAVADAQAALDLAAGASDFTSTIGTGDSGIAIWLAEGELDFGATYWDGASSTVAILDPISGSPSPVVGTITGEVLEIPPALRIVSGAEMRLIIAEHELAVGNLSAFTDVINAIRNNQGLPSAAPATESEARELLIHMRQTYSYLQGRRLADHYRFGIPAPTWDEESVAATSPGTFLPFPLP